METPRERTADRRRAERAAADRLDPDETVVGLLATVATIVLIAALIRVAFPHRSDYTGHFLAGAGATAMLLAFASAFRRGLKPGEVVLLGLLAVALGVGTEGSIFREAAYDWVDFAMQSSGAVLVATAFLGFGDGRRSDLAFGLGFALLLGGCWFAFA